MTSFNISGHEIKDGKLIAIDIELQEPKNTESTDTEPKDSTKSDFIVCANGFFYHYQKIEKTQNTPTKWIRAYLDPADDSAPLHWQEIIFRSHHAFVLAIKPSEVDAIIIEETKEKIKNDLQNTKELYLQTKNKSHIADNKDVPKNEADKADNITLAPKEQPKYEGLDDASQSVINAVFALISERPEIPIGYEEKQWEAQWQQGLIYLISHGSRDFKKDLPAHLHEEIRDSIIILNNYLNPQTICSLNFYSAPTIGAVYDYFIHLIKSKISEPTNILEKARQLSKELHNTSVHSLGSQIIYTGLSQAQESVLMLLLQSFTGGDSFRNCSMKQLEYLCYLLSPNAALTDLDDQILDDFVAIASALTNNHDDFNEQYHRYKKNTYALLIEYKAALQAQQDFLQSPVLKTELAKLPDASREKILTTLNDRLKTIIPNYAQFEATLEILPKNLHVHSLTMLGDTLKTIIKDYIQLGRVLEKLPQDSREEFLVLMGAKLKTLFTDGSELPHVLQMLQTVPHDSRRKLLILLGDTVKTLFTNKGYSLSKVVSLLSLNSNVKLLITLGDALKTIFEDGMELSGVLYHLHPDSQNRLFTTLGDTLNTIIKDGDQLSHVLHTLNKNSQKILLNRLNEKLKTIFENGDQLAKVLEELSEDLQGELLTTLSDVLKTIFKNGYQLANVLSKLPNDLQLKLLTTLGTSLETIICSNSQLETVLACLPKDSQIELLTMLGDKVSTFNDTLRKPNPKIARAVKFYSSKPSYGFSAQNTISNNIVNIFEAISSFEKRLISGHLFTKGESIAEQVVSKCSENLSPEAMIKFLYEILIKIDSDYEVRTTYSYFMRTSPTPTGETAMRIMYCIEQLQLKIRLDKTMQHQIDMPTRIVCRSSG